MEADGKSRDGLAPAEQLKSILIETDHLGTTAGGDLLIEECAAGDLVERFGSPLYVVSEATLRQNYRRIFGALKKLWPSPVSVLYAIKANNNLAVRAILHQEGAGGDCFSEGELFATFRAGADPAKVVVNGSNKSSKVLAEAVERGVTINIDADDEIERISRIAAGRSAPVPVCLRLKAFSNDYDSVKTEYFGVDRLSEYVRRVKWGFTVDAAEELINRLEADPAFRLRGYHFHIGRATQDVEFRRYWAEALGAVVIELHARTGFTPEIIDAGGGWPRLRDPESKSLDPNPTAIEDYVKAAVQALLKTFGRGGLPVPELWIEPGRFIAGNAVVLLATVGSVKRDLGLCWVNIDASSNHLPRIDTNASVYHVLAATGMHRPATDQVQIVGDICADSIMGADRMMPPLERGDLIAILDAGMYADGTATQFNSVPRPATVLVNGDQAELIKEREKTADIFANHRIPERLQGRPGAA